MEVHTGSKVSESHPCHPPTASPPTTSHHAHGGDAVQGAGQQASGDAEGRGPVNLAGQVDVHDAIHAMAGPGSLARQEGDLLPGRTGGHHPGAKAIRRTALSGAHKY